ncbi:unnamed protein product [Mytilus coruscus]|uniref:B box-type domain-containing protein n=1 Tax=Mytilus coruscus TaxID=42192 RepID=A0A6J8F1Y1_MYTCO|nr:unnamed protein product [Mytilus coruscus]
MASRYLNWFFVFGMIGTCMPFEDIGVLLKADYRNGKVILTCKVDMLGFDVIIKNPQRETVGKCREPLRPIHKEEHLRQKGECSTPNTVQYLDSNRTIVTIENPDNDTEGFWTCYHGTKRGDDSVYVPTYLPANKSHPHHEQDQSCNCRKYAIGTFIAGAFIMCVVLFIDDKFLLHIRAKKVIRQGVQTTFFREEDSTDEQQSLCGTDADKSTENKAKCSTCKLCDKETSFAFCGDCQGFYCETCANNHVEFKDHHIIQIKQFQSKHKTKCSNCTEQYPNMVCRECANVLCSICVHGCGHSHDSNLVKQLIITEPISLEHVVRTNSEYKSEVLRKKYNVPISSNKSETRIRGIAFLESGQFVLADYKARQLKIFSDKELNHTEDLNMEPRGLTGITRNRVAVTFAYEKKIVFYDVKQLRVKKHYEFDLKDIGKPFQIAYHNNFFVVEVNEGKDGRIVILNDNGKEMHVIPNNNWEFGYFTGNTFRLQLDMKRREVYVAAIGKKTVYCLDFSGDIKWRAKVPSPRSLVVLPNTQNNTSTLLLASRKASMIYKLICTKNKLDNERYDVELVEMVDEKQIEQPDYMAYDHEKQLMYTEVANGHVSVYDMVSYQHCQ